MGDVNLRFVVDHRTYDHLRSADQLLARGPWLTVAVAFTRRAALAAADGARHAPDPWNRMPIEVRVVAYHRRLGFAGSRMRPIET